jgi:5,10-methylenetetrahydromethanopterin reductase
MKLGVTVGHHGESLRDVADFAAYGERAGLSFIGFSDSQSIYRETWCSMTAAALATERVGLVTTATNVTTRHPVLTASAAASVDEASGGRVSIAVGTGASSTTNLGLKRAKPSELRSAVEMMRAAFRQSLDIAAGQQPGQTVLLSWARRAVPIIVSASGPMATRVAAEAGDGIIMQGDLSTDVIRDRVAKIRAMREAGPLRDEPFQIWLYAPGFIADDIAEGRAAVGGVVSAMAVSILDPDVPEHGIPEELHDPFDEFRRRYSWVNHGSPSADGETSLMEELGLAESMFSRLSIVGTETEVTDQLGELAAAGVETVIFTGSVPDKRQFMDRVGSLQRSVMAAQA